MMSEVIFWVVCFNIISSEQVIVILKMHLHAIRFPGSFTNPQISFPGTKPLSTISNNNQEINNKNKYIKANEQMSK